MHNFDFANSEVFKRARLLQIYSSSLFLILRLLAFLVFILSLLVLAIRLNQNFQFPARESISLSIFGTLVMFEIYIRHKIKYDKNRFFKKEQKSENFADKFSLEAAQYLLMAQQIASVKNFKQVFALHLFLALSKNNQINLILQKLGLEIDQVANLVNKQLENQDTQESQDQLQNTFKKAEEYQKTDQESIDIFDLFVALFEDQFLNKILFDKEIKIEDLQNVAFWIKKQKLKEQNDRDFTNIATLPRIAGLGYQWAAGYTFVLRDFSTDLSAETSSGQKQYYLVGRDFEVNEMENILSRSNKASVLLIGDPGVGKTSVVQKLALKCLSGKTLKPIRFKRIRSIDTGLLLSGLTHIGDLEQRVTSLISEAEHSGNLILHFDQLQNITGAKVGAETVDISGLLLPSLSSDKLKIIASVTPVNYKRYIESKNSLDSAFTKVKLQPPDKNNAIKIVTEIVPALEKRYKTTITYQAVKRVVELANRYFVDRVLPGKAIDLLDQIAVETSSSKTKIINETDVEAKIAQISGIPAKDLSKEEKEKLLNLESILHQRVIGQDEAIVVIADALRRARSGLKEQNQPIGTFLFLGPTGVGKTETAKALASAYFGSEKKMVRLDMSEFQHPDSVFEITGNPASKFKEAGYLTEAIRNDPFSLVLLDELEKAHPNILQLFLQIFDDGRLTDSLGRTVDFSNTIIIATSNAGAEQIRQAILQNRNVANFKEELLDFLQKENIFKPEFLNRFDAIIVYKPLTIDQVIMVIELMIKQIDKRLKDKEIAIEVSKPAKEKIAKIGYDPVFGARSLRRFLQDKIESVMAKKMIEGEIKRGEKISIDVNDLGDLTSTNLSST